MRKPIAGKRGRPSRIESISPEQVKKLAAKGWTDEEISDFFKIDRSTLHRWRKKNEFFCNAVKEGRAIADEKIERALYESAMGYSHPEDKIFNNNGTPLIVPTTKHYAPDTVACMFWLCNRQPEKWKHIQRVEHSGKDGGPLEIKLVSYANAQ